MLKKVLASLLMVSILISGLGIQSVFAKEESGTKAAADSICEASLVDPAGAHLGELSEGASDSTPENGIYPVEDIAEGSIAFDLKYAYGTIHVVYGEEDYRIFQSATLTDNYLIQDGEMSEQVVMTGSHVLVLDNVEGQIQVDAFDSWGYELSVRAFNRSGKEVLLNRTDGFFTIPTDGSVVCVVAGDAYETEEARANASYNTTGDDMTPENNIVLAFAKAVGFDVDSFIEHNGWTVYGGTYDGYYETAQGKKDMSGSVPFTDNADIGSVWPDSVWQGINKWVGASSWEEMNEHIHNGANPGTQCAGLVAVFFGYIYKSDFYKDSDWKAYYDAFSYGTANDLAGTFHNFNGVGMVECGLAGLNYFKGQNGYYVKECNNRTMTHDDFVAMLDQMGPGAVIRFANNIDCISDGGNKFAYQHSAVYIGKANGLHWIFHSNDYSKKARISPLEFFVNCFIQGSQDPDKSTYYLGKAGGMLVVPDEPNATVTVPGGSGQVQEVAVTDGKNAVLSVKREGEVKSCRWQVSKDGGNTWSNVSASKYPTSVTAILTFKASSTLNGYQYRCIVTYKDGTKATSTTVKLAVNKIKSPPQDVTTAAGENATFTVTTRGEPTSYKWQVSKDGGAKWKDVSVASYPSAETATLTFKTKTDYNGFLYRCVVTFGDGGSITSKTAQLTVIAGSITSHPSSLTVKARSEAAFSVAASGKVTSYQWQVSKDGGSTWKNISKDTYPSAATKTLTFKTKASMDGYQYRCRVKLSDGSYLYSDVAVLRVNSITSQPVNATVAAGKEVSFGVEASGAVSQYIWQVSKDGGSTWNNVGSLSYPSSRTATLTFTTKANYSGFLYRCEITFADGTIITSNTAKLTVN